MHHTTEATTKNAKVKVVRDTRNWNPAKLFIKYKRANSAQPVTKHVNTTGLYSPPPGSAVMKGRETPRRVLGILVLCVW